MVGAMLMELPSSRKIRFGLGCRSPVVPGAAVLVVAFFMAVHVPHASAQQADEDGDDPFWMQVREEYVGRFASGSSEAEASDDLGGIATPESSDHDSRTVVAASVEDSEGLFSGDFSAAVWWDLDGHGSGGNSPVTASVHDGDTVELDVYSLWAQRDTTWSSPNALVRTIRAGRQTAEVGIPTTFDGLHTAFNLARGFQLFAFGGRTVHFFESSDSVFEDWIASAGAQVRPIDSIRITADYRFASEDNEYACESRLVDNSYGVDLKWRPADSLFLAAYGRGLDTSISHFGGGGRIELAALQAGLDLRVDVQAVELGEVTEGLDPFFSILGPSLPNVRWSADAWKGFEAPFASLSLLAGWQGRTLVEGDELPFNRDFGKAYLIAGAKEVGGTAIFLQAAVESHFSGISPLGFQDEGTLAAGGSAGWERQGSGFEAGTFYSRYKYRYYEDVEEMADVRTYYGQLQYTALSWLSAKARYELERFDWDVHTVAFSITATY